MARKSLARAKEAYPVEGFFAMTGAVNSNAAYSGFIEKRIVRVKESEQ
jgi:hypothetical protein